MISEGFNGRILAAHTFQLFLNRMLYCITVLIISEMEKPLNMLNEMSAFSGHPLSTGGCPPSERHTKRVSTDG
ncbi:hypothetical protein HPL003_22005 [Paenibacillus terrae HPL-003]|uniref:Uncharacterized protein n=1 Tax=Paenibacillus terrae (strain HPL-003) TaxID=985665 RepID=G7VQ58_PAETH|nr:hypothetical protein HPL003_22005 [Paenibacillus terrae HPL-003]